MKSDAINTDIAIIGGGIAGLWLLNRLRNIGYHALLIESGTLGGGQTIASQGIIHGGAKYTLTGKVTPAAQAVANMPGIWKACLAGAGEIDLRTVQILSQHQYLWSPGGLGSKITTFFASKMLRNRVTALPPAEYPAIFQTPAFQGSVYELAETVLDIPSLLQALVTPCQDALLQGELNDYNIAAQRYIFTAGAGNEALLPMQRRPLHMVMVKHKMRTPIYAHCMETSPKPRVTITTHTAADGDTVWYLGGQIAESGVNKTEWEQCQAAKIELEILFPWLDFSSAHSSTQWSTLRIDRAEPLQANGRLPDGVFLQSVDNKIVAWPTKLALAPQLTAEILALLSKEKIYPKMGLHINNPTYPSPQIAKPIWDQPQHWLTL